MEPSNRCLEFKLCGARLNLDSSGVEYSRRISSVIDWTSPFPQRSNETIAAGSVCRSDSSSMCVAKGIAMVGRDVQFRFRLDELGYGRYESFPSADAD